MLSPSLSLVLMVVFSRKVGPGEDGVGVVVGGGLQGRGMNVT